MRKRKTVSVEWLKDEVARRNRDSSCNPGVREGWNALLEEVLHKTDNYHGFGYFKSKDLDEDLEPDETRRFYY